MNVTIRGYVSLSISSCLTNGIMFTTLDPNTNDNNASCNWNTGQNSGSGYNLTVDASSTVNINFTHASNRTNLTTGTYNIDIGNVTTNSNTTEDNATNMLDAATSVALSTSWNGMEECGNLGASSNCWSTYFLDVPALQEPGNYQIGYCWCGRQITTDIINCGTCT